MILFFKKREDEIIFPFFECCRARRQEMKMSDPVRSQSHPTSILRQRRERRPNRNKPTTSRVANRRAEVVTLIAVKQQQPLELNRPEAEAAGWVDSLASLNPRRK